MNAKAVRALLVSLPYLRARAIDVGDYNVVDTVLDAERAVATAGLTPLQALAVELSVVRDMRQVDVATALGVSQPRVTALVTTACKKIAKGAVLCDCEQNTL